MVFDSRQASTARLGAGAAVGVSDEIGRLGDGRKVEGGRPDGNGHEVRGPDGVRRSRAVVRRRVDDDQGDACIAQPFEHACEQGWVTGFVADVIGSARGPPCREAMRP